MAFQTLHSAKESLLFCVVKKFLTIIIQLDKVGWVISDKQLIESDSNVIHNNILGGFSSCLQHWKFRQ